MLSTTTAGERPKKDKRKALLGQDIFLDKKGALVWRKKKGQAIKRATRRRPGFLGVPCRGFFVHCPEGGGRLPAVKAQFRHSSLDGNGIYLGKQGFHQGEIGELKLSGLPRFLPGNSCASALPWAPGTRLAVTEISPFAPRANMGTVWSSLPDHTFSSSPQKAMVSARREKFQRLLWCR